MQQAPVMLLDTTARAGLGPALQNQATTIEQTMQMYTMFAELVQTIAADLRFLRDDHKTQYLDIVKNHVVLKSSSQRVARTVRQYMRNIARSLRANQMQSVSANFRHCLDNPEVLQLANLAVELRGACEALQLDIKNCTDYDGNSNSGFFGGLLTVLAIGGAISGGLIIAMVGGPVGLVVGCALIGEAIVIGAAGALALQKAYDRNTEITRVLTDIQRRKEQAEVIERELNELAELSKAQHAAKDDIIEDVERVIIACEKMISL